jgi:hypothetical protein
VFLSPKKRKNPDYCSGVVFFVFLVVESANMVGILNYNRVHGNGILPLRQVGMLAECCCANCRSGLMADLPG